MDNITPIRSLSLPEGGPERPVYDTADQISQCAGLARILLQAISCLEDEADMESAQMRTLIDIRLSAEILCERLSATAEASHEE